MTRSRWSLFEPRKIIGRPDDAGRPLMTRWTLIRCPLFSLKLHRFHRADPSCLHDHPWPFVSLILAGGYYEQTEEGKRWYGAGSLLFRPATWRHRVVPKDGVEPLTLVLTGPRVREWGFWTRAQGWIPWRRFGAAQDDC